MKAEAVTLKADVLNMDTVHYGLGFADAGFQMVKENLDELKLPLTIMESKGRKMAYVIKFGEKNILLYRSGDVKVFNTQKVPWG